jgi:chromosomal replication initiator protein
VADQAGDLGQVWNRVIGDLSGASAGSGAPHLSPQQRAFLRLTRPLGLIDGTALLAAPSEFAKDAIERILRRPISDALSPPRGHGQPRVVVDASVAPRYGGAGPAQPRARRRELPPERVAHAIPDRHRPVPDARARARDQRRSAARPESGPPTRPPGAETWHPAPRPA